VSTAASLGAALAEQRKVWGRGGLGERLLVLSSSRHKHRIFPIPGVCRGALCDQQVCTQNCISCILDAHILAASQACCGKQSVDITVVIHLDVQLAAWDGRHVPPFMLLADLTLVLPRPPLKNKPPSASYRPKLQPQALPPNTQIGRSASSNLSAPQQSFAARERERFTSSATFLGGNTPATLG